MRSATAAGVRCVRASLPYLRTVGAALLFVAAVAVIVLGVRRSEALAMELAMADLMNVPKRAIVGAAVTASLCIAAVGSMVGATAAWLLVRLMVGRVDPDPRSLPAFHGSLAIGPLAGAAALMVASAVAGAVVEFALARRRSPGEVLRAAP
ncbi:MAG: hypothetical protein R2715_12410 [Ilumatobacteraceae bacterium]